MIMDQNVQNVELYMCRNRYLFSRTKLLSSTVDSDGRTLHVLKLIRGEEKYYPNCLKQGNKLKKVKFTKPGNSCFDFSVICVLLWHRIAEEIVIVIFGQNKVPP